MASVDDLIALALTKVGYAYDTGPTRTTGQDGYFDCSGFTYFLNQHFGGPTPGFGAESHLQALFCRDHGTLIPGDLGSQAQIDACPIGGLLFEGPQHAYVGGAGIPGHVAVKIGPDKTVEAMGHAWGTCIGHIHGRGWSNAGLFPGLDYSLPSGPHDPDVVQGPQLQGDEMPSVIPARAQVNNGRISYYQLDVQSDHVFAFNGARLRWKGPAPDSDWQKPALLGEGDAQFRVYKIPTNGPHTDIEETKDRKTLLPNAIGVVTAFDGGCAFFDMVLP